jgi:N-succinyldiaminopimelate aminotransferase
MTALIPGNWQSAAQGAGLLGDDGTVSPTIFAEMSALAARTGAINLGQGFPDENGPAEVIDAAVRSIRDGLNQYPPGIGMPVLREAIAEHQQRFYDLEVDPDREVLVTAGATEALASTLLGLLQEGDEVVTFEPFYDAYGPRSRWPAASIERCRCARRTSSRTSTSYARPSPTAPASSW